MITADTSDRKVIDIVELHPHEIKLLRVLRNTGYGQVVVKIQDGLPVFVEEIRKFHRLST